jgi:hypothetical protein
VTRVEIRCPEGPNKLLSKLRLSGERLVIDESNLMELACSYCSDTLKKQGIRHKRVIHRYDFAGSLVDTIVEDK